MRIWIDGCYDMAHFGHFNAFRQVPPPGLMGLSAPLTPTPLTLPTLPSYRQCRQRMSVCMNSCTQTFDPHDVQVIRRGQPLWWSKHFDNPFDHPSLRDHPASTLKEHHTTTDVAAASCIAGAGAGRLPDRGAQS